MKPTPRAAQLGKMLDLCDDLHRLRTRLADPETTGEERTRLRQKTERRIGRLGRELANYKSRGPLARLLRAHRLQAREFEVLAVLLHRAVRAEEPEMPGRLILASIFDTSFGVLSGMHLLHEDARLRASGLVRVADDSPADADILEIDFRLSEEALAAMREEVAGSAVRRQKSKAVSGYRNQRELLLDMRALVNHYRRRSELVFDSSRWDSLSRGSSKATTLTRRINTLWADLRARMLRDAKCREFPLLQLQREFSLDEGELIILVHMLFRELYSGDAFVDVADLLRLISSSESDLIRARHYVLKEAPLLRHQILVLEPFVENRELTAEAKLNDWVVNRLLEHNGRASDILAEERIRWHEYLDELDDTSGFFRDLDA
ncbi:MAG: hypothetical protein VYE77_11930 [Planctomycetota bacterium]|nr:hypothetical protein [Planctomycetota bacterium]